VATAQTGNNKGAKPEVVVEKGRELMKEFYNIDVDGF